jgi:anti-anti-sigma regulatory factor
MSDQILLELRSDLARQIADALKQRAMSNRGTLPPFRLGAIADRMVDALLANSPGDHTRALGAELGRQGLGLPALLAAQTATLDTLSATPARSETSSAIRHTSRCFGWMLEGFVEAQAAEGDRQRAEMERAYVKTVTEQSEQAALLRSTISELSTPIIPVYAGILVLPLVGSVDSRRATEITERLLEEIAAQQAEIVIIDITGVPVIDTSTANHLLMTTRAANLLGSRVILVGIGAEIAQTIVHIGIELQGLVTLANLQAGIAYALGQIGLGIQPLQGRARES